jgi:hypothetical protein
MPGTSIQCLTQTMICNTCLPLLSPSQDSNEAKAVHNASSASQTAKSNATEAKDGQTAVGADSGLSSESKMAADPNQLCCNVCHTPVDSQTSAMLLSVSCRVN